MSEALLLAIDLGILGLQTILFEPSGTIVAAAEYPIHTPHPGWAEQHLTEW